MKLPSVDSIETLSLAAMRRLVAGLVGKMQEFEAEVEALRSENQKLREDNERLRLESDSLRLENQLLRDEIARLKNPATATAVSAIGDGEGDRACDRKE